MNRAMFSGVAGMKAHQSKMDVIGNNISNVNTYGYKSQRAVFSDIFYQTIRNAAAGTATKGGTNPSTIGYGASLSAVQTQMSQSSMQNTGFGLDVAIMGEGFLQVMDGDGNVFYTKAGLLDYDSNGYLTDINGNFVLGSSGAGGTPGSQKIRLDDIGSVNPERSTITTPINGVNYTISASNSTAAGNVNLSIGSTESMPAGLKATATISTTGAISVQLNAFEEFGSMAELNNVINTAIEEANGGKPHAAGQFTISSDVDKFGTPAQPGSYTGSALPTFLGGAKVSGVSGDFSTAGAMNFAVTGVNANGSYTLSATVGTGAAAKTYTATVPPTGGDVTLSTVPAGSNGTISMKMPTDIKAALGLPGGATGPQIEAALNGTINSHTYKAQAFKPAQLTSLTGAEIAGSNFGVKSGTITGWEKGAFGGMKFIKTNNEFSGEGTVTPTDFVADYILNADGEECWEVSFNVGGQAYTGQISEKTKASSLLLKGPNGDYIQVSNPGFSSLTNYYKTINGAVTDPVPGASNMQAFPNGSGDFTVTPSTKSKDLGLGSVSSGFLLAGGTEGGSVTLDELASIAIGTDGTVVVSHPDKGTVVAGRISLAAFANPSGLQQEGSNYYAATENSGVATVSDPGSGGTGSLKSSTLEMSNVDLSSEFSDMITTQRGFQANSRVITVSDTMLEELINLKR